MLDQFNYNLFYLIILIMFWMAMRTLVRSVSAPSCLTSSSVREDPADTSVIMAPVRLVRPHGNPAMFG